MIITSGNTTIDTTAVKDLSKDELYDILKGRISDDFNSLWVKICKANGRVEHCNTFDAIKSVAKMIDNESPSKPGKSSKKS